MSGIRTQLAKAPYFLALALCPLMGRCDDALTNWNWFPNTTEIFVTGRRRKLLLRGDSPSDYPAIQRSRFDPEGVSWACVVDPFAGTAQLAPGYSSESELESKESLQGPCLQAYGGIVSNFSQIKRDGPAIKKILDFLPTEVASLSGVTLSGSGGSGSGGAQSNTSDNNVRIVVASKLELKFSDDVGATQLAVEMATRSQRFTTPINLGTMFFLEIEIDKSKQPPASVVGAAAAATTTTTTTTVHRVGVSLTRPGHFSVFLHSAFDARAGVEQQCTSTPVGVAKAKAAKGAAAAREHGKKTKQQKPKQQQKKQPRALKVMTFNVWNLNAGGDGGDGNATRRWAKYSERMDHLADTVAKAAAAAAASGEGGGGDGSEGGGVDVVAFQEVRHDDSFGPTPANSDNEDETEGFGGQEEDEEEGEEAARKRSRHRSIKQGTSRGSAQVRHLAERLAAHGFTHYVYQPAMIYYQPPRGNTVAPYGGLREEEGPAIFSKWPIVHSDHLLLPRDPKDHEDGHQRCLLHAAVRVPTSSYTPTNTTTDDDDDDDDEEDDDDEDNDEDDSVVVDVYSTHLSLSQGARERAVKHVLAFAKQGKGVMQVVTGDLNAEPQEKALQFLRGDAELPAGAGDAEAAVAEGGGGGGEEEEAGNKQGAKGETSSSTVTGDFVDAWLAAGHSEPLPRSSDLWEVEHALTFPSCNAVKRIDFVLARSNPNYEDGCGGGDGGGGGGGEGTSGRGAAAAAVVPPPPRYSKPVRVLACEVVGQAPNLATAGYTPREGLGMGDADSPVWASDHRAVVATLELPERFRSNNNNHVAR